MSWSDWFRLRRKPVPGGENLAGPEPGEERIEQLRELEKRLGHRFRQTALLDRALTHRSFLHDAGKNSSERCVYDYEALEFFGDTVLGLIISEALFRTRPSQHEGELSKLKAQLVSTQQLSRLSRELDLGRYLRLSYGEEKTGGRKKKAILADIFESLTAALYLDGGLETARAFVLSRFQPLLKEIDAKKFQVRDFKSALQEGLHSIGQSEPSYRVIEESGPDHCKRFVVEVVSAGRRLAQGEGLSKKEAEQEAARVALGELEGQAAAKSPA